MLSESSAFHTAIFDALCACLNLSAAEGIKLIHEAYAEPENAPRPARTKNVIYWTALQDPAADPVSTEWNAGVGSAGTHLPIVCTTVKYNLVIVCYGPACEEYASRIRSMLFLDGRGFPRQILRATGIYPIPDPPQPSLLYEEEGSLWRKRTDLTVQLRVRDEQRSQARSSIISPPAVVFHRQP